MMERKEMLLIALLGFLVLTSAVQAVQLVAISSNPLKVASGGSAAPAPSSGSSGAGVVAPSSLGNLPSMVGGC